MLAVGNVNFERPAISPHLPMWGRMSGKISDNLFIFEINVTAPGKKHYHKSADVMFIEANGHVDCRRIYLCVFIAA